MLNNLMKLKIDVTISIYFDSSPSFGIIRLLLFHQMMAVMFMSQHMISLALYTTSFWCLVCGACRNDVVCNLITCTTLAITRGNKTPFMHRQPKTTNTSPQAVQAYPSRPGLAQFKRLGTDSWNKIIKFRWTVQVLYVKFVK